MNLTQYLAQLREELELVEEAIRSLERIAAGRSRGPEHPPGPLIAVRTKKSGERED